MNIRIFVTGLLLVALSVSLSAQEYLDRYLVVAAQNNPALKARFNDYMAALEVSSQVRTLPDPQVAFGYFINPVETRNGPQQFRLSASQMFPWFGTLKARENIAVQAARAKYELFEEAKSDLFNNIRATYYNLYFNNRAISVTAENIDILNTYRKLAIIKFESGMVSAVDELRVEIEIGEMENQLAELKDNNRLLRIMFNNLLNVSKDQEIELPDRLWEDDFPLTREQAIDSVLIMNHQLLSIDFQKESLDYRQELAAVSGRPSFNIGMDYTIIGKGDDNLAGKDAFIFPTVGITIPIYRNRYRALVKEAVFLSAAKEEERTDKRNMLETLFESGWIDYIDADRRIDLYLSQSELARKSVRLLETDYSSGNRNFEEVLRMERMLLKFMLELEKARADKQAAISFINYLMGK